MSTSAALVALLALAAEPDAAPASVTDLAKQSRKFFESLIDLRVEKGLLVVHQTAVSQDASSLHRQATAAFPNMGRIRVQQSGGSTSMSRGSGGSVVLAFGADGNPDSLRFELQSADGTESMRLAQAAPGSLTLEYSSSGSTVSYAQEKGKCQLRIKSRQGRMSATKKTFEEVFDDNPELAHAQLAGVLEAFFDRMPLVIVSEAPAGKVVYRLQDGARIVGEAQATSLRLETAYGALVLPWTEIRRIVWASERPDETVVTTTRFAPRGRIELESFDVITAFGQLRIAAADIREVVVGPAAGEAKTSPGAGDPAPPR